MITVIVIEITVIIPTITVIIIKMKKIEFTKMVAAGNDFIIIDEKSNVSKRSLKSFAQKICDRKYGVGADGLLVITKSKKADIRMRIFNADGSEAEMCGNGARCAAFWAGNRVQGTGDRKENVKIETKAGIIESKVRNENIRIKLTEPKDIKLNIAIKINNRILKVNFVNTGVPHAIVFVEGLDKIDVYNIGRAIRYHKKFQPAGTNVDFVEIVNDDFIKVRTYERGVEAETLACGTGSTASAIFSSCGSENSGNRVIRVKTRGGEILKVFFNKANTKVSNVWLEGLARIVYKGVFYV